MTEWPWRERLARWWRFLCRAPWGNILWFIVYPLVVSVSLVGEFHGTLHNAQELNRESLLRVQENEANVRLERGEVEQARQQLHIVGARLEGVDDRLNRIDERLALLDPKGAKILQLQQEVNQLVDALARQVKP